MGCRGFNVWLDRYHEGWSWSYDSLRTYDLFFLLVKLGIIDLNRNSINW